MGKNKAGCENDDGEGDKEANYEEEEVVAEVVPVVPGRAAARDDDSGIIVYDMVCRENNCLKFLDYVECLNHT